MFTSSRKSLLSCALLAGAVAGGLLASAPKASAELIAYYDGGVNNGNNTYTYTYTLKVNDNSSPAPISPSDYFVLVGAGTDTLSGLGNNWTTTAITSSSVGLPTGLSYPSTSTIKVADSTQSSTVDLLSNGSGGYLSDLLVKYNNSNVTTTTTPLTFTLTSAYGFVLGSSDLWYYDVGTDVGAQAVDIPTPGGTIPAGPLPLPATFWPGLGTLAAMALVGGVKLRKKFV